MKPLTMYSCSTGNRSELQSVFFCIVITVLLVFSAGCASVNVGYDFPDHQVKNIQIGNTTKEDIRTIFGEPWRTGLENGQETWTYGKYNYSGTRETAAKDLVVRFTEKNIVESYTFSKTNR
jgi:hypothetical protein